MAYKSILLHLDWTKASRARLEKAAALAEAQGAHLTGLCLTATASMPNFVAAGLPRDILQMQRRMALDHAESLRKDFNAALKGRPITSDARVVECLDTEVAVAISQHARYADLVVMGQVDPNDPPQGGTGLVEDVLMGCGRPVLMIPYIGAAQNLGRRVTLAWDAGREAARAASDAMPFLVRAEHVTVMAVNPHDGSADHGEVPGADIALFLARHGVKAEVHQTESPDISVGDELLSRIADDGSDLLVMGAYGHTRLRELVLGGVTRSILEQMTVPVLMSH